MQVGILGAGISGLSAARLLKANGVNVHLFEKYSAHGGIARVKTVNGVSYHITGGHCFNSKYQEVLDFVFDNVLPIDNWHKVQRDSAIRFKNHEIPYPIEFSIKEIFSFDPDLALRITRDLLNTTETQSYLNLEDWFRKKFGDTLAEEYFIPYNSKIWNKNPAEMDHTWVEGKLPIPNKASFFNGIMSSEKDKMPHSEFYYPNSNSQNTFIDNLASELNITYNYEVSSIQYDQVKKKWCINDEHWFDNIISTIPLNLLPPIIVGCSEAILKAAGNLKYNKVTTMLWESLPTERTWTYIPDGESIFHRYIHIGNFFKPRGNFTITEAVGVRTYNEMLENGLKDPFLIKPLEFNISDHAYVVFDENYKASVNSIFSYLSEINLYTLGRFGQWDYFNMDICIKEAMDLVNTLIKSDDRLF